jgi:hypothetical protein
MRKLIGKTTLVAALTLAPALAVAQQHYMAKHEFGVDVAFVYSKPSGGNGITSFATPVDVRIGFVPAKGKLMFEPRVSIAFKSSTGASFHNIDLDVNALYGKDHKKGMYYTAGAGIDLIGVTGTSGSIISLNGGIGTRKPYESGAWRLEAFLRYDLKNTSLGVPNTLNIGARAGLSLWH